MKSSKIKIKAPAKINLSLSITGIREDGYHLLSSIMQTVDLCDTVTVKKSKKLICKCGKIPSEKNIAYKAVKELEKIAGRHLPVKIKIKKRIPDKAGLGGGSADAAAVVHTVEKLYGLNLEKDKVLSACTKAGADVPFLYVGGTALCKGIGEEITPLSPLPSCYIVLVKPSVGNSTPEMYKAFDLVGEFSVSLEKEFKEALKNGSIKEVAALVNNDLQGFDLSGTALPISNRLLKCGALAAQMSGSGTAVFGIFEDEKTAKKAVKALRKQGKTFLVKPIE